MDNTPVEICERCFQLKTEGDHGVFLCPFEPRPAEFNVLGDDIPGGLWIRHGIGNPDGTAKRYDSHTDIKRALNETGYHRYGDTPQPYRVNWNGIEKPKPQHVKRPDQEH